MARLIWSPRAADNLENILEFMDRHSPAITHGARLLRNVLGDEFDFGEQE